MILETSRVPLLELGHETAIQKKSSKKLATNDTMGMADGGGRAGRLCAFTLWPRAPGGVCMTQRFGSTSHCLAAARLAAGPNGLPSPQGAQPITNRTRLSY